MSDFRPCRDCKDWKMCMLTLSEREWFGYQHIRFCPIQIFWLLKYENVLRGKAWPVPDDTAPGGMSSQQLSEANWAKVSLILAELDARLKQCKPSLKGDLLRAQCKDKDVERVEHLTDDASDALYYIGGFDRRGQKFSKWVGNRDYEARKRVKNTL